MQIKEITQVTRTVAKAFMAAEAHRGAGGKGYNNTLSLLRGTFEALLPEGAPNPFKKLKSKKVDTIYRVPYSVEELQQIIVVARGDSFIFPIIATGICTAMRAGDCCLVKKKHVNLKEGWISVKTGKTGVYVEIPIFPLLNDVLVEKLGAHFVATPANAEEHVFPEQASMYSRNCTGITWRVQKVLAMALGLVKPKSPEFPVVSNQEARQRGQSYIDTIQNTRKKSKMQSAFDLYLAGSSMISVAKTLECSKSTVSYYIKEIEKHANCAIQRRQELSFSRALKSDRAILRQDRGDNMKAASIRGFQSFRVTWVTMALSNGVSIEIVRRVTGHRTIDIVLEHYFKPRRADFRRALEAKMPAMFMNGRASLLDRIRAAVEEINPQNYLKQKEALLELLKEL